MTKKPKVDELAAAKRIAARMLAMPPDPHVKDSLTKRAVPKKGDGRSEADRRPKKK